MAKRRRKRRKLKSIPAKSKLPRQESILHAIKCSNDLEWLKEVAAVSRDRYNVACELKRTREQDEKWAYIRTYCKKGTWIVLTTPVSGNKSPELLQVLRHNLIRKSITCRSTINRVQWELNLDLIIANGIKALSSLDDAAREPYEAILFESGLEEIGSKLDGSA